MIAGVSETQPRQARTVYAAQEYAAISIPLSDLIENNRLRLYPETTGKDYFRIQLRGSSLNFQAGGFIGLIPVNDRVSIEVHTRVPVRSLERLLLLSGHIPVVLEQHLRSYKPHVSAQTSLLDMLTDGLVAACETIVDQGIHRRYLPMRVETSSPRGRLLVGATMARFAFRGESHRVVCTPFDPTTDVATNRCLKYALWSLSQRYVPLIGRRTGVRRRLAALNNSYSWFAGVTLDKGLQFMGDPEVREPSRMPANREYYNQALSLAKIICANQGLTFGGHGGEIVLASLLLNMNEVFEKYVRAVLRNGLGPQNRVLDGNVHGNNGGGKALFDNSALPKASPDVVVNDSVHAPLIVEVKYKDEPDRSDLNQAIAYGLSYGSKTVVIVVPSVRKASANKCHLTGHIKGMAIFVYSMDLGSSNIVREEETLCHQVAKLLAEAPGL